MIIKTINGRTATGRMFKAFYEETLPFSKRSYEIVKRIMIEDNNNRFVLSSKTGLTQFPVILLGMWSEKITFIFLPPDLLRIQQLKITAFLPAVKP